MIDRFTEKKKEECRVLKCIENINYAYKFAVFLIGENCLKTDTIYCGMIL